MKFFRTERPRRSWRSEKKFRETLILVFEVIVQPPKAHFLTFSSETKIIKITHSAKLWTSQTTVNADGEIFIEKGFSFFKNRIRI